MQMNGNKKIRNDTLSFDSYNAKKINTQLSNKIFKIKIKLFKSSSMPIVRAASINYKKMHLIKTF